MRWLKAIATAYRCYDQVQGRMLWMTALFDQVIGRLMGRSNFDKLLLLFGMMLTKVSTQSALSIV
jgi:hypothetical protein